MKYIETKKIKIIALVAVSVFLVLLVYIFFNLIQTDKIETDIFNLSSEKDSGFVNEIIVEADPKIFTIFNSTDDSPCYRNLFKDKDRIFFGSVMFKDLDPETFRFIDEWNPGGYDVYCVYADKDNIYFNTTKTNHFDTDSFTLLGGEYMKDKNAVYYNFYPEDKIEGADVETFQGGTSFAEDKNYIYECGQRILPNEDEYKTLSNYYGKNDINIYYKNVIIREADVETFVLLGGVMIFGCDSKEGGYAKDKNNIYFAGKKIEEADVKTFELNKNRVGYARDKNNQYDYGVKVKNDFRLCSSDANNFPEGKDFWSQIIPEILLNTSTSKFEFCLLPDGSKIIGYKKREENIKIINWFDSNNNHIQTTSIVCDEAENKKVGEKSIDRLEGDTVILSCIFENACEGRDFYKLDLNKFRSSPFGAIQDSDEYYDCGYRG
jgi:hypothetical protein